MATEVGKLQAVFDLDARSFDRGLRGVETKILGVTGVMKSLGSASLALQGPLGGVAGRLQGLSALSSQAATGMGALGVGFAVVGAAAVGLSIALFNLVKSSAKVGGELFDLSQKTAFTVETLSGLSIVAKTTGSDINGLSPSLVIFQKNMEAAGDVTSKQGRLFRSLSIDTRDNEKALRQAFTALAKMGEGSHQTAMAMQLFGRSGKDVLAIVKETNGNLDAAIKKYADMGLIISTGAATASDKFNDVLEETTLQLEAVTRSIGMELLPVATDALQSISAGLRANKDEWASWGTSIANVLRGLSVAVHSELGQMLGRISEFSVKWLSLTGLIAQGLGSLGSSVDKPGEDFFGPGGAARGGRASLPGTPEFLAAQRRLAGTQARGISAGGGGRGGGGAGPDPAQAAQRIAELQLDAVVKGLRAEQDANRRALELRRRDFNEYADQYIVIENRRHDAVIAGLDKEQKAAEKLKKGRDVALLEIQNKRTEENITHEQNRNGVLDERAKIVDQINNFLRDQEREIVGLTSSTDQWDRAYQQLVDTLKEEGVELEANTKTRIESNIALAKERELVLSVTRARQVLQSVRERFATKAGRERTPWIDLGGGSTVGGEPGTTTRPRIATVDEQVMRERLAKLREQMKELSGELTSVFSQSISDGFNNGIKSGLQTLAQGLLRIVEDIFLRRMAQGLENMLTGLGTGGGGGNFLTKWIVPIFRAAAGGIGGAGAGSVGGLGSAFAGAFASGGQIPMGQWGIVHDNEKVFATPTGAQVIPAMGSKNGPQVINNYNNTINLPPVQKGSSYNSPKSARQQADMILAYMQRSQT